ncbi:hypothetical protein [Nocardia otitidiscaviarum]|uniref:hypothetical protein n=1 Tax=Nocardia otitidiscaviarum TaxID=1823 RepID=UPI001892D6BE|nr:hypothetical protein [Nocardia otitidiscaviarum]MBF6183471.1 hypothetical protein [Nocardia otitidiscaviarum]
MPSTTSTAAPVQTDGVLPEGADSLGYRDSFARCVGTERLVLLVGQTTGRPVTTFSGGLTGGDQRFVVCEDRTGIRVMRGSAPALRPTPFEGTFFTFTANSQQFTTADGMKFDLARATITVTDDPQRPDLRARTWSVNEYWSAAY